MNYSFSISTFHFPLIKKWNDAFALSYRLIAKLLPITAVNGIGTGNKVGKRPPDEHPSGRGSCEYGKPSPFHQLTEVIGRSDISVKSFSGKVVLRITRLTQMTYHIVGMQIDEHTRKNRMTPNKA